MARTTRPTSENYDFNVTLQDLHLPDGSKTNWKATVREDTGQMIAPVTKDYGVVNYPDVINSVEEAFDSYGLTGYKRDVRVCRDGARLHARYDFLDHTIKVPKVGDEMGLRLDVQSSHDRSCRISFLSGIVRLVCTNGMKTLDKEFSMTRKHSNQINLSFIKDALKNAVEAFETFGNEGSSFQMMAGYQLDQDQGLTILQNLVKGKTISEVTREGIARIWNDPAEHDADRNVYNLLNAGTQFLTHNVEGERFEMADRTNEALTRRLYHAVRTPKKMEKLLIVPKDDSVIAMN
jgi:hypothetical protein